jgi:hypothetical protein
MDWIAGIGLIALIVGGGYFMGYATYREAFPVKTQKPTMRQVANEQSRALNIKCNTQRSPFDGFAERDWLTISARHLMSLWPWIGLDYAIQCLKDYMPDEYGHPDYDWSRDAAVELAAEYANNFGEDYGSNQ